jgi:hypothetical protein
MKIYTSYYGNEKKLIKNNIEIISISLGQPKWIKSNAIQIKELTPEWVFMKKEYDDYKKYYYKKLDKQNWDIIGDKIKSLSNGKDVALCCYESLKNEDEWCHRTMLAEYVNNLLGYKLITEFSEKPKSQYIQLSLM